MHGCEHSDDIGALKTSTVSWQKIEEISGSNAGVRTVGFAEATDPSVLGNVQDEIVTAVLAGSDELLGGEGGCPLELSFLSNVVRGVVSDVGIVGLEGAAHAVEANAGGKQALVHRVGEDQSGRAAGIGTKGDGVKDGEDGFAKANHVVVCWRADNGGVALPRCFEEEDDVRGGWHDDDGRLVGGFLISKKYHVWRRAPLSTVIGTWLVYGR